MTRPASVAVLGFCLLVPAAAPADWQAGRGEVRFGPDMSETEACARAERRAKEDALRRVSGERLGSDDLLVCTERDARARCELNRFTSSTLSGEIVGLRNRVARTGKTVHGLGECEVALEADIRVPRGRPDPGFDLSVRLNKQVFRTDETIEIALAPSQAMHVQVFLWSPHAAGEDEVVRIVPNRFDADTLIESETRIPPPGGRPGYRLRVAFPDTVSPGKRVVDEYLLVLATKAPVSLRANYRFADFKARVLELSRDSTRLVRRAYAVVRPE